MTQSRQDHYAANRSWAEDAAEAQAKSARRAWIIAGVACTVAVLEALALAALAPLKTVVPYTLLVDRNTGFVQAMEGTHPQAVRPTSALTQSLLAQYVVAREGYDIATISEQYRRVAQWSGGAARAEYLGQMASGNPQNPVQMYGRAGKREIRIESVSPLAGQQSALVRFVAERRGGNGAAPMRDYFVAVVGWRFSGEPASIEQRLVNPLGFEVTQYRRDAEAPPAAPPAESAQP